MIEVKNVTKKYVSKNKKETLALKNVSFVLPDKGFVYALGKSGSGKSTLLNLLGYLDTPTDGEIIIDGKSFKDFSKTDIDYFRSTYCGFIFQDYQLINELTVRENISLSLDIKNDSNKKEERVSSLMKDLEIEEYANKYPYELSGGQKQRVGIARALIKKPKVILCDEPTGNLDKETSKAILDLLKKASKDCLVFMVSHDYDSSIIYADRRIVLSFGEIEKDEIRRDGYFNEFKIIDRKAYIPFRREVAKEDLETLSNKAKNGEIDQIIQIDEGFVPFKEEGNVTSRTYESRYLSLSSNIRKNLSKKYILSGKKTSIFQTLGHSLLIILFILIQSFISFEPSELYFENNDYTTQKYAVVSNIENVNKEEENFNYFKPLEAEESEGLFDEVESFDIINHTISYDATKLAYVTEMNRMANSLKNYVNVHGLYSSCTLGTAIVNKEFLNKTFSEGEECIVLAGSLENLDDENSTKLIITDYAADSIIDTFLGVKDLTYDDLIGNFKGCSSHNAGIVGFSNAAIGAIIKTDYKTKYGDLIERYEKIKNDNFPIDDLTDFASSEEYAEYFSDIYNGELALSYSLNPSFYNTIKEVGDSSKQMIYLGGLFFSSDTMASSDDRQFSLTDRYNYGPSLKLDSKYDNEYAISITADYYDKLCIQYKKNNLIGETIYIIKTLDQTIDGEVVDMVPLKIVGRNNGASLVNEKTLNRLNSMQAMKIGKLIPMYDDSAMYTLQSSINKGLSIWNIDNSVYSVITSSLNVFHSLFLTIEIVVVVVLFGWILLSSILNIKKNKYQIGVYKSLGMNDGDIMVLFLSKNLILGASSLILTSLLAYPFFALANYLVSASYNAFMEISLKSFSIFYFHFDIFVLTYFSIILLFVLFTWLPMLALKKIAPSKIVNNKADD